MELHEVTFADELGQYAAQLYGKRDRLRHKRWVIGSSSRWSRWLSWWTQWVEFLWVISQNELERQIKRIREERERRDENMELDMVADFKVSK